MKNFVLFYIADIDGKKTPIGEKVVIAGKEEEKVSVRSWIETGDKLFLYKVIIASDKAEAMIEVKNFLKYQYRNVSSVPSDTIPIQHFAAWLVEDLDGEMGRQDNLPKNAYFGLTEEIGTVFIRQRENLRDKKPYKTPYREQRGPHYGPADS
ncbi:MAG: hypothetical protein HYW78_01250 [Parcubacteria group bacterium]|nr:hypothetical protein [Parcubacteria group bacterium]